MKYLLLLVVLSIGSLFSKAQGLPARTCGIVYTYDAAGNRIKQEYICNNTNTAMQKVKNSEPNLFSQTIIPADRLYPNPTTGSFRIQFVKSLDNAQATIVSMTGQIMQIRTIAGQLVDFNIGNFPSGTYLVRIQEKSGNATSFKVIKM